MAHSNPRGIRKKKCQKKKKILWNGFKDKKKGQKMARMIEISYCSIITEVGHSILVQTKYSSK